MVNNKYGYWVSNGQSFQRKIDALHYASKNKKTVRFYYHDAIWRTFDKSQLGKYNLNFLYRERAQQLRDRYEYLILYYSGGSDSHNILETFIKNNIKLDEVCVKWPKPLIDGKFYTPNVLDNSAKNFWSEWNFAVKPILDKLKNTHPEIKITIKDCSENPDHINFESFFDKVNHVRSGAMLYTAGLSDTQYILKKQIGHIFGVDKPLLGILNNKIYMFFSDLAISMMQESDIADRNTEAFYWAPDFPLLPLEMAYQVSNYYIANPDKRKFLFFHGDKIENQIRTQFQNDIVKSICYTSWDNRFQANKPVNSLRHDKWFWFFESNEFIKPREIYFSELKNRVSNLSENFLDLSTGSVPGTKLLTSDIFFLREIKNETI